MQTPHPPRSGTTPEESDRSLVARLRNPDGDHRAVELLLARHWRATYDYAAICLAAQGSSAALVATTAFRQVLRRPEGGALRPQLLVAAREIVREWAGDETACAVLPELGRPAGGRKLRAAMSTTPSRTFSRRKLADRAFRSLPGTFQCLLWHTEVEAEPITVPAGLLAMDTGTAAVALRQAREQFRAGCIRAHRELAPTGECRFYNRFLDVSTRRGGTLLPDARRHLRACPHCRCAAEQLGHFDGGLEILLTETVLGWGARRYLDSRPARVPRRAQRRTPRRTPYETRPDPLRRYRTVLAVSVGLTALALLVTMLAAKGWADDRAAFGPRAGEGTHSTGSARPGGPGEPAPAVSAAFALRSRVTARHGRPAHTGGTAHGPARHGAPAPCPRAGRAGVPDRGGIHVPGRSRTSRERACRAGAPPSRGRGTRHAAAATAAGGQSASRPGRRCGIPW